MKLNIGCGKDYKEGYINVDISDKVKQDLVVDIEKGLPWGEDTFAEVVCFNVLTQVLAPQAFRKIMNELWFITKPDGHIFIRVPYALDECAWQDPMDCRRFTPESFTYMQEGHRRYEQYGKHYGFLPFSVKLMESNGRQMIFDLSPVKPYKI